MPNDVIGGLIISQGLPQNAEVTRAGARFATMATAAVAGLVVAPTTVAALEIYNNTGAVNFNGAAQSMIITRLFSHQLVTSTTGLGGGAAIWAAVSVGKAPPTNAALAIASLSGKGTIGLQVLTAASQTPTVSPAGTWFPYGSTLKKESAGAVVPGGSLEALVDGRLIVPPGSSLLIHVVSGYTGDTFTSGAEWVFEPLTMA
jgi:hypothetical protein